MRVFWAAADPSSRRVVSSSPVSSRVVQGSARNYPLQLSYPGHSPEVPHAANFSHAPPPRDKTSISFHRCRRLVHCSAKYTQNNATHRFVRSGVCSSIRPQTAAPTAAKVKSKRVRFPRCYASLVSTRSLGCLPPHVFRVTEPTWGVLSALSEIVTFRRLRKTNRLRSRTRRTTWWRIDSRDSRRTSLASSRWE